MRAASIDFCMLCSAFIKPCIVGHLTESLNFSFGILATQSSSSVPSIH